MHSITFTKQTALHHSYFVALENIKHQWYRSERMEIKHRNRLVSEQSSLILQHLVEHPEEQKVDHVEEVGGAAAAIKNAMEIENEQAKQALVADDEEDLPLEEYLDATFRQNNVNLLGPFPYISLHTTSIVIGSV
jgi:hypothetical protein